VGAKDSWTDEWPHHNLSSLVAQQQHSLVTHKKMFPTSDLPGTFPPAPPVSPPSLYAAVGSSFLAGRPPPQALFPEWSLCWCWAASCLSFCAALQTIIISGYHFQINFLFWGGAGLGFELKTSHLQVLGFRQQLAISHRNMQRKPIMEDSSRSLREKYLKALVRIKIAHQCHGMSQMFLSHLPSGGST
jgi:hypothetical protein